MSACSRSRSSGSIVTPSIDLIRATPASVALAIMSFDLIPARGVLQESDLDALALDDRRLVRLVDVPAGAGVPDAVGVEHAEALEDVLAAGGDVVGHADDRDVRRPSVP